MLRIAIITVFLLYTSTGFTKSNLTLSAQDAKLLGQIRCITCSGQTVLDSHSEFASLIRHFVALRLKKGASYESIKVELIEIYGQNIILAPQFNYLTWLLWCAPFVFITIFCVAIFRAIAF